MNRMKLSKVNPNQSPYLPQNPTAKVDAGNFVAYTNDILGRVLTIIDASISDKDQLKAVKSLIRSNVWNSYDEVWRWINKGENENATRDEFPYGNESFRRNSESDR